MKKLLLLLLSIILFLGCNFNSKMNDEADILSNKKVNDFAIIIHGGAGTILKKNMTPEKELAYQEKLSEAIKVGYTILKSGGTSQQAVMKTIQVMEESPLFNAGKGAVFTHEETNELDASFMDGKSLNAGAIAGVTDVKSPIELAIKVMTDSDHVMLSGKGASIFAKEKGLEIVAPSYFYTERRFKSLQKIKNLNKTELDHNDKKSAFYDADIKNSKFGTVGCVALDKNGNIAAPLPESITWSESVITFIANSIGLFTSVTPAIAPAFNDFPSINEASNSLVSSCVKTAPLPALNKGDSSIT